MLSHIVLHVRCHNKICCRRAAATICPRSVLQWKRSAAALSQAGRAWPDQPIRAIQPAGRTCRPPSRCTRQTSDRCQTASPLNAPWAGGIIKWINWSARLHTRLCDNVYVVSCCCQVFLAASDRQSEVWRLRTSGGGEEHLHWWRSHFRLFLHATTHRLLLHWTGTVQCNFRYEN